MTLDEHIETEKRIAKEFIDDSQTTRAGAVVTHMHEDMYRTHIERADLLEELKTLRKAMDNWVEIKTRPLTDEEKELYGEDYTYLYDCELPEDNTDVLVTTKYGYVTVCTFYNDDCAFFEGWEDDGDVIAWMPLPKPYAESEGKQ